MFKNEGRMAMVFREAKRLGMREGWQWCLERLSV